MVDIRPAAAVLALLGSLGIGFSAYLDWLDSRAPDEIPIRLLIDDITGEAPSYWRSLALPLVIASVLGILGVVLRSRRVLALAFIAGLGTFVWWTVREADLRDELDVSDFEAGGLGVGGQRSGLAHRRRGTAPRQQTWAHRDPKRTGLTGAPARRRRLSRGGVGNTAGPARDTALHPASDVAVGRRPRTTWPTLRGRRRTGPQNAGSVLAARAVHRAITTPARMPRPHPERAICSLGELDHRALRRATRVGSAVHQPPLAPPPR